ncbi:type II secretion system F family protein [Geomicrobium sp. JCM 19055]|nr:type II secretion system F family protein [Geomicrobium sp. JCM 19055]GAJ98816.1 Flp pilus assembly protein TadB [Geomicrobium sp. JCM 19055]
MTRTKGGNLADVIDNTAESISDKIMIQQEIKVATAQKKMEASLLTFMPVGIVVILMMLNPDYMQPMYDQTLGTFMLFAAVLMLIANYFIGRKVTNIDV